ncbi:DUF5719 family protein [Sanguibacter suaedae]|uniref:Secreted protein n=1 Tax=Sanguibacter suaedae TaxID=2795737 RepID=A0A934IBL3_9MICO|nr:DUF5719 family protein [Sanguibacter suaedae]MBI9114795.1 hypothetical protein [Sanguibacter suaedae]
MTVRTREQLQRRATRRRRTWAVLSTVVAVGTTGALAALGSTVLPTHVPDEAPGTSVAISGSTTTLVCPAPVALPDPDSTDDEGFSPTPVDTTTTLTTAVVDDGTTGAVVALDAADDTDGTGAVAPDADGPGSSSETVDDAAVLRAETDPAEGTDGLAAASVASTTAAGDLQGVAASACRAPGISQWLVGGGTELGSSTRLVLQNPSRTPATVTVTVWGASGQLDLAGPSTYLVPPGSQSSTLLEGLAAEERRPVVHVETSGALVTSYLQHNVLEGLTPAGVDLVTAGGDPATAQVLAGLSLEESEVGDDDVASVRVLSPADDGTATVHVLGADGRHVLRGVETMDLVAGRVEDLSLAGLPAGTYTVLVQADVPVVAGAHSTREGSADPEQPLVGVPVDRAWVASGRPEAQVRSVVAIPDGLTGTAVLTPLPAALDGTADVVGDVPVVYTTDEVADEATTGGAAETAEAWTPTEVAELSAYAADGTLLGTRPVEAAPGQAVRIDLADLGDEPVATVVLVPSSRTDDVVVDWAVVLADPDVSGGIAVLEPTRPTADEETLVVRRSPAVGLPTAR